MITKTSFYMISDCSTRLRVVLPVNHCTILMEFLGVVLLHCKCCGGCESIQNSHGSSHIPYGGHVERKI